MRCRKIYRKMVVRGMHHYTYIDFENNRIAYGNTDRYGFEIYHEIMIEKDLIDAAYSMLCWAIENKFVETNKNE